MKIRILAAHIALCGLLFAAATAVPMARATSLMYMSVVQMARVAPLIVRARCAGKDVRWDAGEIWTLTSFEVEEVWRGDGATKRVTVRLLGGTTGAVTSHVSGVPRFRSGEEVVLFLEPTKRGDFSVVGWEEGTFRVRNDSQTQQEVAAQDESVATFDPATRRFVARGAPRLLVNELRAQVDAALRAEEPSQ